MRCAAVALMLTACAANGGDIAGNWELQTIGGTPIPGSARIAITADGGITGDAPCNSFSARSTTMPPAFRAENIVVTERQCLWDAGETQFFQALRAADRAEQVKGGLILTGSGKEMRFHATP